MRLREIDKEYRCCLCLHVKTGSILLGLWQVVVHVAVLGVLAALVTHPELFNRQDKKRLETSVNVVALGQKDAIVFNDHKIAGGLTIYGGSNLPINDRAHKKLPSTGSKSAAASERDERDVDVGGRKLRRRPDELSYPDVSLSYREREQRRRQRHLVAVGVAGKGHWRREDRYVGMALTFLSLVFSGFLLYGSIKERPSYLMPYFCLQVFDFVISCLSIVGYFSYLPDVKVWLRAQHDLPYKQQLLHLDQATLTFTAMTLCLSVLVVKAYLLGMVWTCYKFFVRKQTGQLLRSGHAQGSMFEGSHADRLLFGGFYDDNELGLLGLTAAAPTEEQGVALGVLPPKYDDVLKTAVNANAPPPYFTGQRLANGERVMAPPPPPPASSSSS